MDCNFLREGEGYLYCLKLLQGLRRDVWLVNQHVDPTFRFSAEQFARMRAELLKQRAVLAELAPWPDLNYAIDESWASVIPYASEVVDGGTVTLQLRILNHGPRPETYQVKRNVPAGWKALETDRELAIPQHQERAARAVFAVGGIGLQVVTADVGFAGRQLREWAETLVRIRR